jgi:hypothetical protein
MKKLLIGIAAAGVSALIGLAGAQAQSGMGQTGMGNAMQKDAPSTAGVGTRGMRGRSMGMRMRMHRHRHMMRHHRRHMM